MTNVNRYRGFSPYGNFITANFIASIKMRILANATFFQVPQVALGENPLFCFKKHFLIAKYLAEYTKHLCICTAFLHVYVVFM